MYDFVRLIREIERSLKKISLFELLLSTTFLFLFFNLLFFILDIPRLYAALVAIMYFAVKLIKVSKLKFFKLAENFEFKEKLKTAWDNANLKNILMEYLAIEVLEDLSYVKLNPFVRKGKIILLVLGCILLSFSTIYLTTNEVIVEKSKNLVGEFENVFNLFGYLTSTNKNERINQPNPKNPVTTSKKGIEDIYGKSSIASLENTVNVKFQLGGAEAIFSGKKLETTFSTNQIEEVNPVMSEAYHENIPQAYEEVVKRYFERLRRAEK